MNDNKAIIVKTVLILASVILTCFSIGCKNIYETSELKAGNILTDTIAAMAKVKTYSLNTYLVEDNIYIGDWVNGFINDTWQWSAQRQVDTAQKKLHLTMGIRPVDASSKNPYNLESFVDDGWYYTRATVEPGNTLMEWGRGRMDQAPELNWDGLSQMAPLLALLKESSAFSPVRTESFNGVACFVLDVEPSSIASANWIISQEIYYGPSFGWLDALAPDSMATYVKTYQSGNIRFIISRDSNMVLKMIINLLFDGVPGVSIPANFGTPQGVNEPTPDPGINHMIRNFFGEWEFSGYNQPLKFVLPEKYFDVASHPE